MRDSSIETQERGTLSVILGFIGSVFTALRLLIGLALLLIALAPPLMNKQMPDQSKIARKSKPVTANDASAEDTSAEDATASADGAFVSMTGPLTSDETVGDPLFNIGDDYVFLRRRVEMYSWNEIDSFSYHSEHSISSDPQVDRKDVTDIMEYSRKKTYIMDWSGDPLEIYSTGRPEQYLNPPASIQSERFTAENGWHGGYRVNLKALLFSSASPLTIDPETFTPANGARIGDAHEIFVGKGSLSEPKLGDLRIKYDAVESGATVTLFGKLNGDALEPYAHKGDVSVYRVFVGSREDALDKMQVEHRVNVFLEWALRAAPITKPPDVERYRDPNSELRRREVEDLAEHRDIVTAVTWAFRVVGFFILWIGLCLFVGPIKKTFDSALTVDATHRSRLVLPMLLAAALLSAVLWAL